MQKTNIDGKEIFHYSAQKTNNNKFGKLLEMDSFIS